MSTVIHLLGFALVGCVLYWDLTRRKNISITFRKLDALLTKILANRESLADLVDAESCLVILCETGTFSKALRQATLKLLNDVRSLIDSRKKINHLEQKLASIQNEIDCLTRVQEQIERDKKEEPK